MPEGLVSSVVVQHRIRQPSFITFSCEIDDRQPASDQEIEMEGPGGGNPSETNAEERVTEADNLMISSSQEESAPSSSSPPSPSSSSSSSSSSPPPESSPLSSTSFKSADWEALHNQKRVLLDTSDEREASAGSSASSGTSEADELAVLDKGYAWVIVVGGLLTQILIGGLMRTDGIFYPQFLDQYEANHQVTSWPGALSFFLQCFVAPVASWFCNRYSVRTCVILGTFLVMSGLAITAFAPNIYCLFLSYSLLQGIGRGLVMAPGIYIINMYFDRYRGIALGLASAGTGVGTLVLAPLFEKLFISLGYRNAFLVIAAMSSVGWVAAALFRPLSVHKEILRKKRLKEKLLSYNHGDSTGQAVRFSWYGSIDPIHIHTGTTQNGHANSHNKLTTSSSKHSPFVNPKKDASTISTDVTQNSVTLDLVKQQRRDKNCCLACVRTVFPVEATNAGSRKKQRPFFHWALFRDFPFLVLCASMAFFNLAQKTIFSFLEVICVEQGLTKLQATWVLSMTGVGDIVGRVAAGIVMDLPWMISLREVFYSLVLFFAAGAALIVPFSSAMSVLCVAGALYGAMVGASVSQKSTVLAALMGKEMVNSAFGIQYSFQGIGTLAGPPLAGALSDMFKTYSFAFFMSSGSMAGAGALVALSTLLFKLRRRRDGGGTGNQKYKRLPADDAPAVTTDPSLAKTKDEHAQSLSGQNILFR